MRMQVDYHIKFMPLAMLFIDTPMNVMEIMNHCIIVVLNDHIMPPPNIAISTL